MATPPERLTLKERLSRLFKLNNSPREIALGVAIGVFIGITPLYGLHTVMVIGVALVIKRVNKIAMLLGTSISTTPTVPFITWAGYSLGRFMLGDQYPPLRWDLFKNVFHQGLWELYQIILALYYPLFLGSVVMGSLLALIFYFLVFWTASLWKKRSSFSVGE